MKTVLAVFAHPDDETFICGGALAASAAKGNRVVLVCATKGEMGRRMGVPPLVTRETIASVRDEELRAACDALGVARLCYLGLRDKTLEIQPLESLADKVLALMEEERPDVVITFHERLGGHPDHCAIGAAATDAWSRYTQRQNGQFLFVAWTHMGEHPESYGLDPSAIVEVDVSRTLPAKLAAYRAHKTQSGLYKWLWKRDNEAVGRLAMREYFIHAGGPKGPLDGLW